MNDRVQNLEETLDEGLMKMRTRKVVEKILQSKDVKASYNQQEYVMRNFLAKFEAEMMYFVKSKKVPFEALPDFVTTDNIVELSFVFIMTKVDDEDLVEDVQGIAKMLLNVDGGFKEVAHRLYNFLYEGEHRMLSEYSSENLLKAIIL